MPETHKEGFSVPDDLDTILLRAIEDIMNLSTELCSHRRWSQEQSLSKSKGHTVENRANEQKSRSKRIIQSKRSVYYV